MRKLGILGLLIVAQPAVAAEPKAQGDSPAVVALRYEAEPGCPTEQQFTREVSARVRLPIRWSSSDATLEVSVRLERGANPAEVTGVLHVERQGDSSQREFTSNRCDEVASALALVAALTLDPNARTEPISENELAEGTGVVPPPPVAVPKATSRQVESKPVAPHVESAPAAPRATARTVWGTASADLMSGYAPKWLALLGVSAGFRAGSALLSPSLQLSALWGETGITGPTSSRAKFAWAVGRLEGCPISWAIATRTRLDPCAVLELGRLTAHGSDARVDSVTARRPWLSAGASLALHESLGALLVRAGAAVLFPIERDEFVFQNPEESLHRPSAVAFGAGLSVGFQFGP